ncbi:hypothetical protein ACHAWT_010656 [Skeletonema menzelii]
MIMMSTAAATGPSTPKQSLDTTRTTSISSCPPPPKRPSTNDISMLLTFDHLAIPALNLQEFHQDVVPATTAAATTRITLKPRPRQRPIKVCRNVKHHCTTSNNNNDNTANTVNLTKKMAPRSSYHRVGTMTQQLGRRCRSSSLSSPAA